MVWRFNVYKIRDFNSILNHGCLQPNLTPRPLHVELGSNYSANSQLPHVTIIMKKYEALLARWTITATLVSSTFNSRVDLFVREGVLFIAAAAYTYNL